MNVLYQKICKEIQSAGVISFARFMELALYDPDLGYYEQVRRPIGREGDFFTSVRVGPLFGELLACQFVRWLAELDANPPRLVEAGAHDGRLAADILSSIQRHWPDWMNRLEYGIVEPSERRQRWQQETLEPWADCVRWYPHLTDLGAVEGLIFSNELLDAFPVHRLGWDAGQGQWFTWGIGLELNPERFVWVRMPMGKEAPPAPELDPGLKAVLPDAFTIEVSPSAEAWWRSAAQQVQQGKLLTIDYGMRAEEFFMPHRRDGTLRAYYRHQLMDDPLARVGEQDLTAHVNFTAIEEAGWQAGLTTEAWMDQAQFLTRIAEELINKAQEQGRSWESRSVRQFQTLTHPEHLGRSFRVLIQRRGG